MTVFQAKNMPISLLPPLLFVLLALRGIRVSYPRAKNVTCGVRDITPRDTRKQKYIFLLRKMTKIIVTHSDLNK